MIGQQEIVNETSTAMQQQLHLLYSGNVTEKKSAEKWLIDFQSNPLHCPLCLEALGDPVKWLI